LHQSTPPQSETVLPVLDEEQQAFQNFKSLWDEEAKTAEETDIKRQVQKVTDKFKLHEPSIHYLQEDVWGLSQFSKTIRIPLLARSKPRNFINRECLERD